MAKTKDDDDNAVRGNIFLHPCIWEEFETLAKANGIQPAEQLRSCALEGLRIQQRRNRAATGMAQTNHTDGAT